MPTNIPKTKIHNGSYYYKILGTLTLLIILLISVINTKKAWGETSTSSVNVFAPSLKTALRTSTTIVSTTKPSADTASSTDLNITINSLKLWQENGEFQRELNNGSKGNDVLVLQSILKSINNDQRSNVVSGFFGPKTKASLSLLQTKLNLAVSGKLDEETKLKLNTIMFNELCPTVIRKIGVDNLVKSDFNNVFNNLDRLTSVPLDYIPEGLTLVPSTIKTIGVECVSDRVLRHLEEMVTDAKKQKLDIAITSSYRSADMQKFLYAMWVGQSGNAAKAGIAEAGHSEHQLGTTIDVSGKSIGYSGVNPSFAKSKEGEWMAQNSYKYGFILSYPSKKEKVTGYIYEPWHFRYIGVDNATDIFTDKITIQEYLNFSTGSTTEPTPTSSSATSSASGVNLSTTTVRTNTI